MADSLAMSKEKNQPAIVFGKVIKNLRLERGLTQNNLADIINSERSHISDIERGIKSPSLAMVFRLSKALSISSGELIQTVENQLRNLDS